MQKEKQNKRHVYWNPYFGGFLLGLLIIFTFYITGRGLGAGGAVKSDVVTVINKVSPEHTENNAYYKKNLNKETSPMNNWLVFEALGVIMGAFLSGAITGRIKLKTQHSPKISANRRLVFALIGGLLFGFGAQIARGCTSGAALSGVSVMATAGFISMLSIFGTGYLVAYFFRKNWI
ncbi:YeeE/YedE thiosulfate transporter family protein [Lutimonas vermicola]|uniref:YeeE/YedE thiosulfate transporter family protein n=1 Tax=Lutimonas vermicola TaxID=414288 RepID=A0ABU9KWV4_9FLAO